MPDAMKYPEIAELMLRLKARTTLSFNELGKRVHFAKPTVNRWFNGVTIPDTFEPLEQLARMCQADEREIAQLRHRWETAIAAARARTAASRAAARPLPAPIPGPPPLGRPPRWLSRVPRRRPRGWEWTWVTMPAVLVLTLALIPALRPGPNPGKPTPAAFTAPQGWYAGTPTEVDPKLFGATINGGTGHMPSFPLGAVRISESGALWSQMQPAAGPITWTALDREVAAARSADLPVMYSFGSTPGWAAPNGNRGIGGLTSPPDDLRDWDHFVDEVSARDKGRIESYEVWKLVGDDRYYTGSASTLVQMTRRARDIIRRNDPHAIVVCPSMGRLYDQKAVRFLQDFARFGGYELCDVIGVKLYPIRLSDPPEQMFGLIQTIDRTFRDFGLDPMPPLWDTGTAPEIASEPQLNPVDQVNYAVRFFLVGLFARYGRMYFYNWGGAGHPVVLQVDGDRLEPPTPAATSVAELERWMRGAKVRSCGAGPPAGLPDFVFRCRFVLNPALGTNADVVWTSQGSAPLTVGESGTLWRLNGGHEQVRAGQPIMVTGAPILLPAPAD
jgi:hypothetical protein